MNVDKPKTNVTVQFTVLKFYDAETNTVVEVERIGKMTVSNCRKYVKEMNEKNIFIGKTTTNTKFQVDSAKLYSLKLEV